MSGESVQHPRHTHGPVWFHLFLGHAPAWFKLTILAFLIVNPLALWVIGSQVPAQRTAAVAVAWDTRTLAPPVQDAPVELLIDGQRSQAVALAVDKHGPTATVWLQLGDRIAAPTRIEALRQDPLPLPLAIQEFTPTYTISGGLRSARFWVGWMFVAEFVFVLAMALACYPLLAGGLLAFEAIWLGLCTPAGMYAEAERNFPVILLLVFVVAGVNFLKPFLSAVFTRILFATKSKTVLALLFCVAGAFLSAFLDALTVTAVIIAVCKGFWDMYHDFRSRTKDHDSEELEQFRAFLRSLVMHATIGTALGGVCTMVGEPQNLLIAHLLAEKLPDAADRWGFVGFFWQVAVVSLPTLAVGLLTCVAVERLGWFGYGAGMPEAVRQGLDRRRRVHSGRRPWVERYRLAVQGTCAGLLILALAFHWAEVGIIGLFLIVLVTSFNGISDEHRIGQAFTESLPFTSLLVVFFAIVALIDAQDLFRPAIEFALAQADKDQQVAFFLSSAALSVISDNVFVATVFINEATSAYETGRIAGAQYEKLAVAINTGTNIPSIATPNGQAALLFLLTSALADPIRLGYMRMVVMALPYTLTMTAISLLMVKLFL